MVVIRQLFEQGGKGPLLIHPCHVHLTGCKSAGQVNQVPLGGVMNPGAPMTGIIGDAFHHRHGRPCRLHGRQVEGHRKYRPGVHVSDVPRGHIAPERAAADDDTALLGLQIENFDARLIERAAVRLHREQHSLASRQSLRPAMGADVLIRLRIGELLRRASAVGNTVDTGDDTGCVEDGAVLRP